MLDVSNVSTVSNIPNISNISNISNIQIYSIFILILILSGGYTIEIIPCRLKKLLTENIFIKHFFCFLTLIFFVSVTDSTYDSKNLRQIIFNSFLLYILFMFIIKTQYKFFVVILILLAIIYLIKIKNDEINQDIKNENIKNNYSNQNTMNLSKQKVDIKTLNLNKDSSIFSETNMKENPKNNIEKYIKLKYKLVKIKNILIIIILILIFIGFFVYLGQKKYEYKNKFSYITFLFGAYKCKNTSENDLAISKSIKYLFTT